jgi:hypothetical protein
MMSYQLVPLLRMSILLGNLVEQCNVLLCCLLHRSRLSHRLIDVAQRRIETIFVSNVFDGAHLIVGINILESTTHCTRPIRNFSVGAINVSGSAASTIAEGVRARWWAFGGCFAQMGNVAIASTCDSALQEKEVKN